jgi:hypothetical protein
VHALIPVLTIAVIAAAAVLIVAIRTRAQQTHHTRRELARHTRFLHDLHRRAITDAAIDPTSALLADDLANHLAHKETP